MKEAYRRIGLLGIATIVALLVGALLQHFSALPSGYTWLEPVRTLRLVFEHEWTPATFFVVYLIGVMSVARDELRTALELGGAPLRTVGIAMAIGLSDAVLFPLHNGWDVAAMVALGVIVVRRSPPPGARALLVGHGVFAAVAFAAICYCFSVAKALILVGRTQADPSFIAIEKSIFGVDLYKVIAAWASTRPKLVALCDLVYFRLFHHMALTTVLLFGMRQRKERFEYLGALGLCYLLGGPLYHLFPGVGPSYFDQEAFGYIVDDPSLATNEIRFWLYRNTMDVLSGQAQTIRTWGYVACMPSLHIAHELVMLYYARRSTVALAISSVFTSITLLAVVVLGWHYAIDAVGGLALAAVAIALARWQRDRLMPAVLAPLDDEPLPPRRSLRAWIEELRPSIELPAMPPLSPRVFVWLAIGAFALRLGLALIDLEVAERLFVPDYAYYTLSAARSIAHGDIPASAFSPLLAFLSAPAFALTTSESVPLVWVFILCAVADAVSVWLLGRLATRVGGPLAGVFAAAAWALSPLAIANALDGLETAIALAFQLGCLEAWSLARERKEGYGLAGVLAGLALLARIDSAFLVAALGVIAMIELKERAPLFARMIGGALAVVTPWWLYASIRFGSPIPRGVFALHESLEVTGISVVKSVAWLGGALLGGAFVDLPRLRTYLFFHETIGVVIALVAITAVVLLVRRVGKQSVVAALTVQAVSVVLLYVVWLPALWFFRRYLEPVYALIVLTSALAAARALGPEPAPIARRLVAGLALVLVAGFGLGAAGRVLRDHPGDERGLNGAKGMSEPAREVMQLLPNGAVVGAFQSGALIYFARPGVRVVDLSGVVDPDAKEALEERRVLDYAAKEGVTHIADSRVNVESLRLLSPKSIHGIEADPIGQARPKGGDAITVYAVRLPVAGPVER